MTASDEPGNRTARRRGRKVETSDYAAFMLRVISGLADRIADDPAMLAHVEEISRALTDAVNRGIYIAKNKDWQPYSLAEMGRIYGCSYQNIQQRAQRGEAAMVAHEARRSAGALVRISDIRAARAARLRTVGVEDLTGSVRERSALRATGTDNVRQLPI